MSYAKILKPARRRYSGTIADPARWDRFRAKTGDVILLTPPKSGTTWTQSMIAMLLKGDTDLGMPLGHLSPWIDANFFDEDEVLAGLEAQTGRRVIKTHAAGDGIPVWEGVKYVAVYRHPMEVMLSLRNHMRNTISMCKEELQKPVSQILKDFLKAEAVEGRADTSGVATLVRHLKRSLLEGHLPDPLVLNYRTIKQDHRATVGQLNDFLETGRSDDLLDAITAATEFDQMKSKALDFAPEAGRGFWKDDAGFFAHGKSGNWRADLDDDGIAAYHARMAELLPDTALRNWFETGEGDPFS